MAVSEMNYIELKGEWSDSGNTYTNLTIYRCGKLRVATGYISGSHAADEVIWTLNDIDKPVGAVRFGGIGTNKCVGMLLGTNKDMVIVQAIDSMMMFNFSYVAETYA